MFSSNSSSESGLIITLKVRLVLLPLTSGAFLVTVPLVAVRSSETARSSVAAASTAMVPPG